jgi:hypothetical protein
MSSATKAKSAPEAEPAKHPRIIAAEIVAGFELEKKIKQIQSETAIEKAEEASQKRKMVDALRFEQARFKWLSAKANKEEPEQEDEQQNESCKLEAVTERAFFTTPAVYPDHVWVKLEAFEEILAHELRAGERTDSILLLALGCIKQDCINLDLLQ